MQSSLVTTHEKAVCVSARLTVKCVDCDKTEESSTQIFIPYERSFSLVFWKEEWFVRATPSTWNFGSTSPCWSENADFQTTIARTASAVTSSEKVQLTLIRSRLHAFEWA